MWFNTSTGLKLPYYFTQAVDSWWDNGSLPIWITAQRQASGPPPRHRPCPHGSRPQACSRSYGQATISSGHERTSSLQTTGSLHQQKNEIPTRWQE